MTNDESQLQKLVDKLTPLSADLGRDLATFVAHLATLVSYLKQQEDKRSTAANTRADETLDYSLRRIKSAEAALAYFTKPYPSGLQIDSDGKVTTHVASGERAYVDNPAGVHFRNFPPKARGQAKAA